VSRDEIAALTAEPVHHLRVGGAVVVTRVVGGCAVEVEVLEGVPQAGPEVLGFTLEGGGDRWSGR
jgi:hypothetical protein